MPALTPLQVTIATASQACLFVHGPASCGKTTAGVARLEYLLEKKVPAESILVLTPQRTLQAPYLALLRSRTQDVGGEVTLATIGGLARRMCELFWPLAAEAAGFAHPERPPIFLTLETAQYFMARLVRPLIEEEGFFESVTIDRNRLYAQILDNLNKSAAVGFPYTEIGARLDAAWQGDPAQRRVYADVQACATRFRQYCLEHNLLDFSLQLEIFATLLWREPLVREYLSHAYRHLIYDNIEEDIPRVHDLLAEWLPDFDTALLIYDEGGGYRRFLGADPESALRLQNLCTQSFALRESFILPAQVTNLATNLVEALGGQAIVPEPLHLRTHERAFSFLVARYYPELLDAIVAQIQNLVFEQDVPPSEIVVLSPYLSDALRFSLMNRLEQAGLPVRSHRPSRSLREEPATQCLLTLAALAHPAWEIHPSPFAVAYAWMLALGMDLVRARLLTEIVYRPADLRLSDFAEIRPEMQERITYLFGERYSALRAWLLEYRAASPLPLDLFLRRLFGEVLSQPGFGFHDNYDHVRVAGSLVESFGKFRRTLAPALEDDPQIDLGREYYLMLQEGVIAAQYLEAWQMEDEEAILVAPAHTFLMMNRAVRFQFWLDIGSSGWTERLAQPLTHPYVLSRQWMKQPPGRLWTDADESAAATKAVTQLVNGLLLRCMEHVFLGLATISESGFEQRGGLLRPFQKLLQQEALA